MKTIALQIPMEPVAGRMDSPLRTLAAGLRRGVTQVSGELALLSERERVLREAETLRTLFLSRAPHSR